MRPLPLSRYYSGRRVWGVYRLLAPSLTLPAEYEEYRKSRPYPVTARADKKLTVADVARRCAASTKAPSTTAPRALRRARGVTRPRLHWVQERRCQGQLGAYDWSVAHVRLVHRPVAQLAHRREGWCSLVCFEPIDCQQCDAAFCLAPTQPLPANLLSQVGCARRAVHRVCAVRHGDAHAAINDPRPPCKASTRRPSSGQFATLPTWPSSSTTACMSSCSQSRPGSTTRACLSSARPTIRMAPPTPCSKQYEANARNVLRSLWELTDELMFKYADGYINEVSPSRGNDELRVSPDYYPDWWLAKVGYTDGPPPVPRGRRTCHFKQV